MADGLHGKVAVVTGASTGIGRAVAQALIEHGARVVIAARSRERLDEAAAALGPGCAAVVADVTRADDVRSLVDGTLEAHGRIDILVANAGGDIGAGGTGIGRGGRPNPDDAIGIPLADIKAVMDRNLLSCILCCREVAPELMARKGGRIISIGSIAGLFGRDDGVIYSVAKAAVHEYTRCLAVQLRPYNVSVNAIAPGDTRTERFLATRTVEVSRLTEEGTLDRIAMVDEVARVVEFFAGPLGAFVSGQVLRVDGAGQCWPA